MSLVETKLNGATYDSESDSDSDDNSLARRREEYGNIVLRAPASRQEDCSRGLLAQDPPPTRREISTEPDGVLL